MSRSTEAESERSPPQGKGHIDVNARTDRTYTVGRGPHWMPRRWRVGASALYGVKNPDRPLVLRDVAAKNPPVGGIVLRERAGSHPNAGGRAHYAASVIGVGRCPPVFTP
ncbi:hypothetical protein GCM10010278_68800 [Streptomyces melanogenes]|nr:hypothetical protein GCM10010278_68800 [Streptomyces melanogenes]